MADIAQLEKALINADAAGDVDAAKTLAGEIKRMRSTTEAPKEQKSWGDEVMGGLASGPINMYLGAKQAFGELSPVEQDVLRQNRQAEKSAPIASIASNIGALAPAMMIPGVNTVAGSALLGGAAGAISPTLDDESRATNAAIGAVGGALGQGAANTVGRMVQPVRAKLDPIASNLASKAKQMGINLSAAQQTGSKPLRWIDSALDNLPITAEKQATQKIAQREAWQKAALAQAGESADTASTSVMGGAKDRLGAAFNDLSARNTVTLDPQAQSAIKAVEAANAKAGPLASDKVSKVTEWLKSLSQPQGSPILGANGKPIPTPPQPIEGKIYQEVRSILSKESKDAFNSQNSRLGQSLKDLRNALDDAATRSISPQDAKAWTQSRSQYGALKAIEKATDPTTGQISPKKLVNELSRKNPNAMIYGKGDQSMADIAKVGKQFIAENLPDSGTAQRSWYMNMLQNPTGIGGGLLGFAGAGPVGALGGMAAGAATPVAAQKALWSGAGKKYLSEGAFDTPQMLADLLRASTVGTTIAAPLQASR
jgi:hypothetical protein